MVENGLEREVVYFLYGKSFCIYDIGLNVYYLVGGILGFGEIVINKKNILYI